jgi:NAD dependent epimerase/dehydratase family enzyme
MNRRVVVVGATGQIGRPVCGELIRVGHTVVVFSRDPARARRLVPGAADYVAWGPDHMPAACASHLESADAVVYLAGGPLFDGRRHITDILIRGKRVIPVRASALGYQFAFSDLHAALHDLLDQPARTRAEW